MDAVFVEEVIGRYIELEENVIKTISEKDGSDRIGTAEWKVKEEYAGRLRLLERLKFDLLG